MASEWTIDTLKEYVDSRMTAMQQAVDKADHAYEKRMDSTNEWRNALSDQQATFVTITAFQALSARVKRLEDQDTRSAAKTAGIGQLGTIIATSIATAGVVVAIFAAISNA